MRRTLLGFFVLLAACGDSASSADDAADTTTDEPGAGGAPAVTSSDTSSSGGSVGAGGNVVDPATLPDSGLVTLEQLTELELSVDAAFRAGREDDVCTSVGTAGACIARRCPQPLPIDDAQLASAGVITVSGGSSPLTVTQGADGRYALTGDGDLFGGASTLEVAAPGDAVPAFRVDVTAPSTVADLTPAFDDLALDPSADLDVSWTPVDASGAVQVVLLWNGAEEDLEIECHFDVRDGAGSVPASLFADTTGVTPYAAYAGTSTSDHVAVGTYDVELFTFRAIAQGALHVVGE